MRPQFFSPFFLKPTGRASVWLLRAVALGPCAVHSTQESQSLQQPHYSAAADLDGLDANIITDPDHDPDPPMWQPCLMCIQLRLANPESGFLARLLVHPNMSLRSAITATLRDIMPLRREHLPLRDLYARPASPISRTPRARRRRPNWTRVCLKFRRSYYTRRFGGLPSCLPSGFSSLATFHVSSLCLGILLLPIIPSSVPHLSFDIRRRPFRSEGHV